MLRLWILCSVVGMADPQASPPPSAEVLKEYGEAKAKAGRDAGEHVRLAVWCGEHGMEAEKAKHLGIALLLDPRHARARELLGLESAEGKEKRAEEARAREELLAEYREKLAKGPKTAEEHWTLALWCEKKGLAREAAIHLWQVVRLDPKREAAWKRLGFKKHEGRWMTPQDIAESKAEAEAQERADRFWKPWMERWRSWLAGDKADRRDEAARSIAQVVDPRSVPTVAKVFGRGSAAEQAKAVQVFGQIESPGSTRALAVLSVVGKSPEVRRAASESLRTRDPHDFASFLIALLREPIKYEVREVNGPGLPGTLFVEGKDAKFQRLYAPPSMVEVASLLDSGAVFRPSVGVAGWGSYAGLPSQAAMSALPGTSGGVDANGNPGHWAYIPKYPTNFFPEVLPRAYSVDPSQFHYHAYQPSPAVPAPSSSVPIPANVAGALAPLAGAGATAQQDFLAQAQQQMYQQALLARMQRQAEYEWLVSETQRMAMVAKQQQLNDVAAIERANSGTHELNGRVVAALAGSTGRDFGIDREEWSKWWSERSGYVYVPPGPRIKPTLFDYLPLSPSVGPPVLGRAIDPYCALPRPTYHPGPVSAPIVSGGGGGGGVRGGGGGGGGTLMGGSGTPLTVSARPMILPIQKVFLLDNQIGFNPGPQWIDTLAPAASCFSGATPVATPDGPRTIDSLRPGDLVSSRDPFGALTVSAVSSSHRQLAAPTIRLSLSGTSIETTRTHPFWKVGHGWTPAGLLSPGDLVRTRAGEASVDATSPSDRQAVYNLLLDSGHVFFVGASGAEVHDGSVIGDDEKGE